jgi:PEP-CTERM motif
MPPRLRLAGIAGCYSQARQAEEREAMTRRSFRAAFEVVGCVAVLMFDVGPIGAEVVTFDDVAAGDNDIQTSVNSGGFNFASDHFHITNNPAGCSFGGCVGNRTQYASEDAPTLAEPVTMTKIGGGTFSLTSFDGAETFINSAAAATGGYPNAAFIRVVGNLSGGGTVVANFQLDGVKDGNGGVADFQHFVFGPGWTNLTSAVWSGGIPGTAATNASMSFDNIVVSTAPEPGTLLLLGSALTGVAISARRRRRTK